MKKQTKAQKKVMKLFKEVKLELAKYDIESVAAAAGVGRSTLYKWLSKDIKSPQARTLLAVAEVLGFEVEWKTPSPVRLAA